MLSMSGRNETEMLEMAFNETDIVVYVQYYRCRDEARQRELDECLHRNLNHPRISRLMLFVEEDAPALPEATRPFSLIPSSERMTYSEWFGWVRRQGKGIALLLNSDIYLDQGLDHLAAVLDQPDVFLALTRYNPGQAGLQLNQFPHWTQDVWGVRADAVLPESLLYASAFPLGFPGCDNRIAHVMWSHGFRVRNPCYHVRSVHLQDNPARAYDKTSDRLYGGVSYVHPSLSIADDSELEFALWTRSLRRPVGMLINQQAIDQGVHQLLHRDQKSAQPFLDQQTFTSFSWQHQTLGSAQLTGASSLPGSEDALFLSMPALLSEGIELELAQPRALEALTLRLPEKAEPGFSLEIELIGDSDQRLQLQAEQALSLRPGGERLFWKAAELGGTSWRRLILRLRGPDTSSVWEEQDGAELVLFAATSDSPSPPNSPAAPTEPAIAAPDDLAAAALGSRTYRWQKRSDCERQIADAEVIRSYGSRFRVLLSDDQILFEDRFWPTVGCIDCHGSPADVRALDDEALFALGFLQPVLEWKPGQIASDKTRPDQILFWQFPCRTEEDALAVHQLLVGPQMEKDSYHIYVGLPWATFIDLGVNESVTSDHYPETLLLSFAKRIEALITQLRQWGRRLRVHSVCQHIFWRDAVAKIKTAGITDLWISHKEKGLDLEQGVSLHSWCLYAVNDRDVERSQGLHYIPVEHRGVFASFSGAHMKHYISDVRLKMAELADLEGYRITIKGMWHFNEIVYNYQVFGDVSKRNAVAGDDVLNYNQLLSQSRFSLCPVGAGPNTLRLWESLAVGAIPVVLSDRHELPDLNRLLPGESLEWDDVLIVHPEEQLDQLDARLRGIDSHELHRRQRLCRRLYEASVAMTCFGHCQRFVKPIPLLQELFKPQQVQVPGMCAAVFSGISQRLPARLALSADGPVELLLHFDQTEQILAVRLTAVGCSLDELDLTISRYLEFNQFQHLPCDVPPQKQQAWIWLPAGEQWWAMGLRLTASWKQQVAGRPEAELQVAVLSEKDAYAREVRRLDHSGRLRAASERNTSRGDDLFDSKHINSGAILSLVDTSLPADSSVQVRQLYPPLPTPRLNLIGEELGQGISMYVHLMNRNANLQRNLSNWLSQDLDELILLDWSSSSPVAALPGVFDDPRVRVVRVQEQSRFIRTVAQNLASRLCRHQRIFKCDSDVEFKGDFFAAHPLEPGEFWVGDWHQARDANERHLHGETYYFLPDFLAVGGYDERIKSYGQDDTNLKDRMLLAGMTKKVFDYDMMEHQHHDQVVRAQGSHGLHPMVATYANRVMTSRTPLWNAESTGSVFELQEASDRYLEFRVTSQPQPATEDAHVLEAMQRIARWYVSDDEVRQMSAEQMNALIWDRQVD